ncbi:MAG: hypothetical protein J7L92_00800 [Dehalococcoidia bacterium]|nr:hypothetical protein [Deltaproteobacteria bacterium]MCD6390524.1 hypothetical protein [Dehalococcoidia bacterium]
MANPEMDRAAEEAAKELDKLDPVAVKTVATWWSQHYVHAGHKRLARKLLDKVNHESMAELKDLVQD